MRTAEDSTGRFALAWLGIKYASQKSVTVEDVALTNQALLLCFLLLAAFGDEDIDPFIAIPVGALAGDLLVRSSVAERGEVEGQTPRGLLGYFTGALPSRVTTEGNGPVAIIDDEEETFATIRYETVEAALAARRSGRLADLRAKGIERCRLGQVLGSFEPSAPAHARFFAPSYLASHWAASVERIWAVRLDCGPQAGVFLFAARRQGAKGERDAERAGYPALGWVFFSADQWALAEPRIREAFDRLAAPAP